MADESVEEPLQVLIFEVQIIKTDFYQLILNFSI